MLKLQAQNALSAGSMEEKHQQLERLISGVDRSTRVVEQMLLLARLDADAIPLQQEALALDELTRDTLASLTPLALSRRQELVLENADADFRLTGHAVLLGAMLRNLVENALRHSPEDSEIVIRLTATAGQLQLEVLDAGPGADPSLLGELSQRFVRANQHDTGGSGLGLAIVAHIVGLHRGQLHLANLQPRGLKVSVTLPRHP